MIVPANQTLRIVLYEGPGSHPMGAEYRREVLVSLLEAGYAVTCTGNQGLLTADGGPLAVLGLFAGGAPEPAGAAGGDRVVYGDLAGRCSCAALATAESIRRSFDLPEPRRWTPWFPVIDRDRCAGCKQCANFCLFGVYRVEGDGRVVVAEPDQCKTNCPACARMCPQAAIIFPKFPTPPINGAEVRDEDVQGQPGVAAVKDLLAGDAYAVLRRRSETSADPSMPARLTPADLARLAERAQIPPEVLASLGVAAGDQPAQPCGCATEARPSAACNCDCPQPPGGQAEPKEAREPCCGEGAASDEADCCCQTDEADCGCGGDGRCGEDAGGCRGQAEDDLRA